MINRRITNDYFEWLSGLVCGDRLSKEVSYRKLLLYLHQTEFRFIIRRDVNRAKDGVDLRRRFALIQGDEELAEYLDGPCSILEMMVALALRCEECIMDDPHVGNRTGQWFWGMIVNLNLGSMIDDRFDTDYVAETLEIFLDREYEPNGDGGLFTIKHCLEDLRDVEIWVQLLWYLDSLYE